MKAPRALLATTVTVALMALAACTSAAPSPAPSETPLASSPTQEPPAEKYSVQFVSLLPNNPVWRSIGDCMATRFDELGVDFTESGTSGEAIDVTAMVTQIQHATSIGKQAILSHQADDTISQVMKQAQEAGVITGSIYGTADGADFVVGLDWYQIGKVKYVETIAEREGPQVVGLVVPNDTGIAKEWMDGFKEGAAATSNVTVAGAVFTNDDSSKALDQVTALLTAHPDINVIASFMASVNQGAAAAITNKGLVGEVVLVGNGPTNGGQEALDAGIAYKMLLNPFCDAGTAAADTTVAWLSGDESTAFVPADPSFFGKDEFEAKLKEGWA